MKKAGVIGGLGFIESEIIALLLNTQFDVKVSTEDISKKENYQHLMELDHSENLYVCEIDFQKKSALKDFSNNCDLVVFIKPTETIF